MGKKPPSGAQAVLRAISLLKAFTAEHPERELAELARESGLSRSTTHRLLAALESEGLVVRDAASSRYRLGPTTVALGARAMRSSRLREIARPALIGLARETGETATLEVLSDGKMLILDEVLGAHLIGASPSLGTAWAVHATSTGKALLAALSPEAAAPLRRPPLARFTANTIVESERLDAELEQIRARGYATVSEELEAGYAAVGAVIRVPVGEPSATLSVGGPSARMTAEKMSAIGEKLTRTALDVARALGFEVS